PVSCNGGNNGSITVTASGGNGSFQYSKDNGVSYQAGNVFNGLAAGAYTVVVKDGNNCLSAAQRVTVREPLVVRFTHGRAAVSCNGGNNGSITVTASGGNATFQYSKDNGVSYQAGNVFNGLAAGAYTVVVKDGNNCLSAAQTVTVSEPLVVSFTHGTATVSCN